MGLFSSGNAPGFQSKIETEEVEINWVGNNDSTFSADQQITLDDENTDSGNTPTGTIRGGMLLARETASQNEYIYDPDANDGRQFVTGILDKFQDLLVDSVKTQRFMRHQVTGLVKTNQLIVDSGTRGTVPLAAQSSLARLGFKLDQNGNANAGAPFLSHPMGIEYISATTKTLTAADNGKLFISTAAGNYTLPANSAANEGFKAEFFQSSDNALVITSAAGDDIIGLNNAAADTLTYSTGSQQIGSCVSVELRYTAAGTRRWIRKNLGGTTEVAAG